MTVSDVVFTEKNLENSQNKEPIGNYHLFFHFRNGWDGFWKNEGVEELTEEEHRLIDRILNTINHRWHGGCNSDLQLFLENLSPIFQKDDRWYSIVASENHNVVVRFGRNFGNIDYPVLISVYR